MAADYIVNKKPRMLLRQACANPGRACVKEVILRSRSNFRRLQSCTTVTSAGDLLENSTACLSARPAQTQAVLVSEKITLRSESKSSLFSVLYYCHIWGCLPEAGPACFCARLAQTQTVPASGKTSSGERNNLEQLQSCTPLTSGA